MFLKISTDYDHVVLPKVVVSVFADQPTRGRVTVDIEVLTLAEPNRSLNLTVDDPNAEFIPVGAAHATGSPYEASWEELRSYVGTEYGLISNQIHADRTGERNHFVIHADSNLQNVHAGDGRRSSRLSLAPHANADVLGEDARRDVIPGPGENPRAVDGVYVLGGWCRLVRDWPDRSANELVDRMQISVRLENLECGGLYVWMIAPKHHQFDPGDCEVRVDDAPSDFRRMNFQKIQGPEFTEFALWKRRIVGREVARNSKRITCKNKAQVELRVRMSSPELHLRARQRSFLVGAGMVLSCTTLFQIAGALVEPPTGNWMWAYLGAALVSAAALIWLIHVGLRQP